MRYTITITKVAYEEKIIGKSWEIIGKDANNQDMRGYTPEITAMREVERKVYEQTIDTLDLPAVIIAVNKLVAAPA